MSAFDLAIDMLFSDANLAVDGLWRQGGVGAGVAVRLIRRAPDLVANFGDGRFVSDSTLMDVRVSDVATLAEGDTFQIGTDVFVVQGDPLRDSEQLVWKAEVRAS